MKATRVYVVSIEIVTRFCV